MKLKPSTRRFLARKGVEYTDLKRLSFKCQFCGLNWSPLIQIDGRLPRGYWKCPNSCNAHKKALVANAEK